MTRRVKAAHGSLAFVVLAPGIVAGLVPWLITHWGPLPPADGPDSLRWSGLILIVAGVVVVIEAFARFAWEGLGTPAPVAPTRTLVVSGFYRFVRNPMYVAVMLVIFGQSLVLGRENRLEDVPLSHEAGGPGKSQQRQHEDGDRQREPGTLPRQPGVTSVVVSSCSTIAGPSKASPAFIAARS